MFECVCVYVVNENTQGTMTATRPVLLPGRNHATGASIVEPDVRWWQPGLVRCDFGCSRTVC